MKTKTVAQSRAVRIPRSLVLLSVFVLGAVGGTPVLAAESKTHTLFMGADFSLEMNGEVRPVVDVVGDAFVIRVDGKDQRVPMNRGQSKIQVRPTLKITERAANLDKMECYTTFTAQRDPSRALIRAAQLNADIKAAANQINADVRFGDAWKAALAAAGTGGGSSKIDPAVELANQVKYQQLVQANQTALQGAGVSNSPSRGDVEESGDDAIALRFEISAPRALAHPYIVCVAQYRPKGAKAGELGNWIYARILPPIGQASTKVHLEQGGFPVGFDVEGVQVHLYDGGEEIATNVSAKRVELTRSEAHLYVVSEYIGSHKGATVAAQPAMGRLPEDFRARLAGGSLKDVVYVKVDSNGRPLGAFRDRSCAHQVEDPYVSGLVAGLLFKPALTSGKPVEGVAAVDFAKLVL